MEQDAIKQRVEYARKAYQEKYGQDAPVRRCRELGRTVIYTVITGDYDIIDTPEFRSPGADYVCFTNNADVRSDFWEIRLIESSILNNIGLSRKVKILPHLYFSDYETSIYVDAKHHIRGDLLEYARAYMGEDDMLSFPHFERSKVSDEAESCIMQKRGSRELISKQIESYKRDGFPDEAGLYDNSCIVRRHNSPKIIKVMEAWWEQLQRFSARDQLSLPYVCWKENFLPAICDQYSEENSWLARRAHFSPAMRGTGYNYLYPLQTLLHEFKPRSILEFHIGNETRLTIGHAASAGIEHMVLEQFPADTAGKLLGDLGIPVPLKQSRLALFPSVLPAKSNTAAGVVFPGITKFVQGKRYELILLKCMYWSHVCIHMDLLQTLPGILADRFAILMDRADDRDGRAILKDIESILHNKGIPFVRKTYPMPGNTVCLLRSPEEQGTGIS